MPYTEDDLLPISALQHLEFCPRRCALIHIEGAWTENVQTAEGRALHEKVHECPSETIQGVRVARGLRLCSRELGLFGIADVVEFQPTESRDERTVTLPGSEQRWTVFPVEYKRGRRKSEISYLVQLCAQALCLEEMLGGLVPAGALYHGQSRRRQVVELDATLRTRTWNRAHELHRLIESGTTPEPVHGPKCKFCSLAGKCMPKLSPSRSARDYVARTVESMIGGET
jgi:CRISPR-associated exonuclease Cas4